MNEKAVPVKLCLDRLLFRRQFLLGPREFLPNQFWASFPLNQGYYLSTHIDLPCRVKKQGNDLMALIGLVFDPTNPTFDEDNILEMLFLEIGNFESLIKKTEALAGRWIIIYQDTENTYLFNDSFGFRSIYYHSDGTNLWCASQPELIRTQCDLRYSQDSDLLEYIHSSEFSKKESPLYGPKTIYQDCSHLLPNHYLNLKQNRSIRFYPSESSATLKTREMIVEESSELLKGIFSAITNRHTTALALTSGWDSRLMLAASREFQGKIQYFTDRKGILTENHPDVWVPDALAKKLGLKFEVRSSELELPGWFISLLSKNVTCARILPKSRMVYSKYLGQDQRVYLNGNGGEIFRNYYDKTCRYDPAKLDTKTIIGLMGHDERPEFLVDEINTWMDNIQLPNHQKLNMLDFLYWEQRIGNWGVQFPSEQDIAVEEISPFNCRLLIGNLLSIPREDRAAPNYPLIRDIILRLWPEVLDFPINPPALPQPSRSLRNQLKSYLREITSRSQNQK